MPSVFSTARAAAPPGVPMKRPRAMVIEDDPGCRELLTRLLDSEGYAVTATDSALGAAALVRWLRPQVVVLELALSYRSGATLLANLKADPRTAHIPVIMVSAMPELLVGERRAMAADVIGKPLDVRAVLDAVRATGRPRRLAARGARSATVE